MLELPSAEEFAREINKIRGNLSDFHDKNPNLTKKEESDYIKQNLRFIVNSKESLGEAAAWIEASKNFCQDGVYELLINDLKENPTLIFDSVFSYNSLNDLMTKMLPAWDGSNLTYVEYTGTPLLGEAFE